MMDPPSSLNRVVLEAPERKFFCSRSVFSALKSAFSLCSSFLGGNSQNFDGKYKLPAKAENPFPTTYDPFTDEWLYAMDD